jgi:hypothetical protein
MPLSWLESPSRGFQESQLWVSLLDLQDLELLWFLYNGWIARVRNIWKLHRQPKILLKVILHSKPPLRCPTAVFCFSWSSQWSQICCPFCTDRGSVWSSLPQLYLGLKCHYPSHNRIALYTCYTSSVTVWVVLCYTLSFFALDVGLKVLYVVLFFVLHNSADDKWLFLRRTLHVTFSIFAAFIIKHVFRLSLRLLEYLRLLLLLDNW